MVELTKHYMKQNDDLLSIDFHTVLISSLPWVIFNLVQRGSDKSCAIFDN